jgi:hypothetical protein
LGAIMQDQTQNDSSSAEPPKDSAGDAGEVATMSDEAAPATTAIPSNAYSPGGESLGGTALQGSEIASRSRTAADADTLTVGATAAAPDAVPTTAVGKLASDATPVVRLPGDIIYTANVSVEVDNISSASAKAKAAVAGKGGWVSSEQSDFGEAFSSAVLTFRVQPKQFDALVEELSKLGRTTERNVSSNDVSGQLTDLKGRTKTLEISISRLQGFLNQATDPNQIGFLESELLRRETELETMRGQIADLEAQVAESTIVLTLATDVEAVETPLPTDDGPSLGDGWDEARDALVGAVNAILIGAAVLAPFALIGLLLWLVIRSIRRDRGASPVGTSPTGMATATGTATAASTASVVDPDAGESAGI